jgi:hypothetical protein
MTLRARILPKPNDFIITNRKAAADRPYALDPLATRNYFDLKFRPDSSLYASKPRGKFKKLSPDQ